MLGWVGLVSPDELVVLARGVSADAMAASLIMVTGAVVLRGVLGTLRPVPSSSSERSILVLSIPPRAANTMKVAHRNPNSLFYVNW